MEQLVGILYYITVILKTPVIICILLSMIFSLYRFGGFLHELYERLKHKTMRQKLLRDAALGQKLLNDEFIAQIANTKAYGSFVQLFFERLAKYPKHTNPVFERIYMDLEFKAEKQNTLLRIGIRIGPALGLMGTLIPMGSALMGLAQGNIQVMSSDLIIAFSTTVAGLFVGMLCYVILATTNFWFAKDMADIEFLKDILTGKDANSNEI